MRISDWSSDVCSSDLSAASAQSVRILAADADSVGGKAPPHVAAYSFGQVEYDAFVGEIDLDAVEQRQAVHAEQQRRPFDEAQRAERLAVGKADGQVVDVHAVDHDAADRGAHRRHRLAGHRAQRRRQKGQAVRAFRSEEHTSELQSLMRISYAVFCLKKKNTTRRTDKT